MGGRCSLVAVPVIAVIMGMLKASLLGSMLYLAAGANCDAKDHPDDCAALCDLRSAATIDGWCNGTSASVCGWPGVTCADGRVTRLMLNHLVSAATGPVPASIGKLSKLQQLDLTNCKFNGQIPEQMGDLSELQRLWLGENNFTHGIPAALGKLVNLQQLVLHYNRNLGGGIPSALGKLTNLVLLLLNNNSLTGGVPESLGGLSKLGGLGLFSNKLTSWTGDSICKLVAGGLADCELQDNAFACPLPACAANCSAKCQGQLVV